MISFLHLPSAYAKTNSENRVFSHPVISTTSLLAAEMEYSEMEYEWLDPFSSSEPASFNTSLYEDLHLDESGLNREAFDYAQKGWEKLLEQGMVHKESIIAIADFSQPSNQKRLYVIDMENNKVLFNTFVSHGKNSGKEWTSSFSNQPNSYKSSPGFYITGDTYNGSNGYSLRLNGVEKGINDNAFERAIVMHGADYVSQSFAAAKGYIGRSHGCPAVPMPEAKSIINTLKNGACLFLYTPGEDYTSKSSLIS